MKSLPPAASSPLMLHCGVFGILKMVESKDGGCTKVLLGLTDEDLEQGLGVTSSMHRRKLRLAIEDYREAETGKGLSKAADMDHHWVAKAWLSDIGLPQYSQAFQNHLVDGRMLSSLGRRDLEKYLSVSKKLHQVSIMLAIELLHLLSFDKEVLQERRSHCENQNTDPIVWTSQRVMKWIRDIDLKEYVDSLQNSGVHGAVLVLEPAFHTEAMANTLGIPSSKHIVRRHLMEEMRALISSARVGLQQGYERSIPPTVILQGSLGRLSSFMRRPSADEHSLKGRTGKPPLSKAFNGKELDGRYNSLPREGHRLMLFTGPQGYVNWVFCHHGNLQNPRLALSEYFKWFRNGELLLHFYDKMKKKVLSH